MKGIFMRVLGVLSLLLGLLFLRVSIDMLLSGDWPILVINPSASFSEIGADAGSFAGEMVAPFVALLLAYLLLTNGFKWLLGISDMKQLLKRERGHL